MARLPVSRKERDALFDYLNARYGKVANELHGIAKVRNSPYERYGKRAIDIVFSSLALVITMPINTAIAIGTFIDVGRPIMFKQERVGRDGKTFILYKFRNMTNECDADGHLLPAEQRVTKFGRIMRSTSLDELLNFWSIFKGDMSIIGPRPLLPEYSDRYCDYHRARLMVRPGLECPPSPNSEDALTWEGHFNDDVWYAEHVSLLTDLREVFRLFAAVFNRRSVAVRGSAARSFFVGYGPDGRAIGLSEISDELLEDFWGVMDAKQ